MNRKAEGRIDNFFPNKAKQAEFVAQRALNNKQKLSLLFGCFQGRRMKVFCTTLVIDLCRLVAKVDICFSLPFLLVLIKLPTYAKCPTETSCHSMLQITLLISALIDWMTSTELKISLLMISIQTKVDNKRSISLMTGVICLFPRLCFLMNSCFLLTNYGPPQYIKLSAHYGKTLILVQKLDSTLLYQTPVFPK